MAKKRRKQQNRSRNRPPSVATRTVERPRTGGPNAARTDATTAEHAGEAQPTEPTPQPRRRGPAAPQRPSAGPQRSRTEKKELARKEREAARRRMARAQRRRQLAWVAGLTVVVAAGVFLFTKPDASDHPTSLPGELTTEAPWDANAARSAARGRELGLPAEGTTMHEHANVQVFVHGTKEPVPTDIGINASKGTIQSIHTHDDTGTVHLESSVSREFTLADFFGVWGIRFTPSCLGAYCNDDANQLQVFVDAEEVTGDLQGVQLDDQSVIVVTYGTVDELPDPIPSTFDFSSVPQ
jgi:hypothetical protein